MSGLAPMQELRAGRYQLLAPLRVGGCGVVWRCLDTRDSALVALKAVPVEGGGAAAVEHEAEAAARVQHPGALRVHAAFVEAGHGCLVLELAACSLEDVVDAHGPLPEPVALRVALDLCAVLGAAHAAGVVHRDVKPPNVLVLADGAVRLGDWGIARVHASGQGHTRTGAMLGTIAFMAPEQRRDPRHVRPATDLYALAATLAWMLTGAAPGDLFVPEVLASLRARLGAPLASVLAEAGRHEPGERPDSAAALGERLRALALPIAEPDEAAAWLAARARGFPAEPPPALAVAPSAPPSAPPRPRSSWAAVLGGVGAVALAAGVAWRAGDAAGLAAAARDPWADLPRCDDAASQWGSRVERGPRESVDADIVDLDGDGMLDVVYANTYSQSVTVWWGAANAMPSVRLELPAGRLVTAPGVADVDGDGVPDLVVALFNDSGIAVLRGLGARRFATPTVVRQDPPPWQIAGADLDGDHRADLVYSSRGDPTVYLRRATGALDFTPQQGVYAIGTDPVRVVPTRDGLAAWSMSGATVRRAALGDVGVLGAVAAYTLPAEVGGLVRDASHPDDLVARVQGARHDALVRIGPGAPACVVGVVEVGRSVEALGDLDGDGVADVVGSSTCQFCDSNHVFGHGIR